MEYCAITVYDISLLARADSTVWDPASVFERLIPRREITLKRTMLHASHMQTFSRRLADDAGTVVTKRPQLKHSVSIYDVALGAKDTATITVNIRPLFDLSALVATTLREFLEGYANRVSNVDFDKMRMSPLMTVLLKQHVREYLGAEYAAITNRKNGFLAAALADDDDDDTLSTTADGSTASSYSYYQNNSSIANSMAANSNNNNYNKNRGSRNSAGTTSLSQNNTNSISSSINRQLHNETQPIRFGPPVELLSSSPLSVHLTPYGRHAFFPELLERRRTLESQMHVDPTGWRCVVFPPKLLAAVLRIFVVVLNVPARIVLPRLQEVLPGAVEMHYASAAQSNPNEKDSSKPFSPPKIHNPKTMVIGATSSQYPLDAECAFGIRYFSTMNVAAKRIVQRTHMLCCDAFLVLHYTPHPVFGSAHESPLITESRALANRNGVTVIEKVDLNDQQILLQVLGNLAKRFSHIFVVYEDINAYGGAPTADVRLVLTRVATNKFTLLVDGTYNVGNACAPARAHWLNSARNTPGSCCGDAYLVGVGAFLPTVIGRAAFVIYSATKCLVDVEACTEDPTLPLLIDDALVVQMELVKAMTAETLQQETHRAASGLADDAKEQLANVMPKTLAPTVASGILCIPVPHLADFKMNPGLRGGRRRGGLSSVNDALFLTAAVNKQLENVGVTCAFAYVNLIPTPSVQEVLKTKAFTPMNLLNSVSAEESSEHGILCAIMTPHLQTIEQVSWNLVWKVIASGGAHVFKPERVPTLEPAPTETEIDSILSDKKKKLNEELNVDGSVAKKRQLENMSQQEKDDAELLELIKLVMGDNNNSPQKTGTQDGNNNNNNTIDGQRKSLIEQDRSGETDFIARDPYSYASRLDSLLSRYDPSRTLSGWAILNGIVCAAEQENEGFMGYHYDERAEKEAERNSSNAVSRALDRSFSPLSSTVSSVLRRDVIEAAHLARMVLRYGKEPTDNTSLMIAEILKEFAPPAQFEKFPVLVEAYRGKEHQLLESLLEKLVPPHKRGLFRSRPMLLRAPPTPESDVALARRMIHKCFVAHRPNRLDEISSLAHLLAPLVTLVHQRGKPDQQQRSNPLGYADAIEKHNQDMRKAMSASAAGMDFLKEEETFGVLVRQILEQEVGIVPRAVGSRIGIGGGGAMRSASRSPSRSRGKSPGGPASHFASAVDDDQAYASLSPAQKARMAAAKQQENLIYGTSSDPDEFDNNQQGNNNGSRSHSMMTSGSGNNNSYRSPSFLDKMFRGVGGAKDDKSSGRRKPNVPPPAFTILSGDNDDDDFDHQQQNGSRSASLAVSATQRFIMSSNNNQNNINYIGLDDDEIDPQASLDRKYNSTVLTTRERVIRVYARYEPAKIPFVGQIMEKWIGREQLLISALTTKYGPEPPFEAPIKSFTRTQHLTQPGVERPGALVNVIRDYYHATNGPSGRAMIDEALESSYPLEDTAKRVYRKAAEDLQQIEEWKERRREQARRQQEWEYQRRVNAHMDPNERSDLL